MTDTTDKVLGLVLVAALVPIAIASFNDADTTGWSTSQIALWAFIGVAFLIGIVRSFMKKDGSGAA